MKKPNNVNIEDLTNNKMYYWLGYDMGDERSIFRMKSYDGRFFCFVDYPNYACGPALSHFEYFSSLEDAEYALEYYKWEKEVNAQIAKESKFLQKLGWSKEESEHRKKMYKIYKKGFLLTRKAEKELYERQLLVMKINPTNYRDVGEYKALSKKENILEEQWNHYFGKLNNIVSKEDITIKEFNFWNELQCQHFIRARERKEKKGRS